MVSEQIYAGFRPEAVIPAEEAGKNGEGILYITEAYMFLGGNAYDRVQI